ncbi:MAG: cytosine/creatinine deaminase [Pseudonocardiales bacterium]|jgi:cytosine deaminase|nr:cytosine/creatinine deaminase [Pseudonocardiales bacterium]MDT7682698.1 cytosine/creatinine deaminase [Pseudonocardiales bacterium]MDT7697143.1 cytosine/creatinine deaminase [Pseudonocardiales bacterium]MDT7747411.1 cytosine/creatinine deaminase [Pseudonocardiales bacterium]
MADLVLRDCRVSGWSSNVDIAVESGRISWIGPKFDGTSKSILDCGGDAVISGLIEPHLHLDKALLDAERPNEAGTLAGAIAVTGELKRSFTHAGVRRRAARVLEQAVTNGTSLIRAHPDIDPIVGLLGFDVVLGLREDYADLVDLQVVAFPQEGILRAPGTLDLLVEALRRGADVIGGCSYNEESVEDSRRHVDLVFGLAERFGVPVDIHADFADDDSDPRFGLAEYIAERTRGSGLGGQVTLGHMTSLAGLDPAHRKDVLADLADAGVAVVVLPATDMHLSGRADRVNIRRGIAPVRELLDAGVRTGLSSNNVRNGFTPFGNTDVLDIALFLAQTSHLGSPEDFRQLIGMVTTGAADIVGAATDYGVRPGALADLVVLDAATPEEALLSRSARRFVLKNGRVVASTEVRTRLYRGSESPALPSEV